MSKINGYTEEEAKGLVEYIKDGKKQGKTLTYLFASYGAKHGRAKGSVRNYYYALMKNPTGDERIVRLLDGSELSVEKIREFSEEETTEVLRSILMEKSKGMSVRRAICNLSGGDDKLMLRLQNKYRNTLKKEPERLALIASELGIEKPFQKGQEKGEKTEKTKPCPPDFEYFNREETQNGLLQRRLEKEINALYDRLTRALKEENERLRRENSLLKAENDGLKKKLS